MTTNFIHLSTNQIFTPTTLKMRGINPDNLEGVRLAGYSLVTYEYPTYDRRTHKIEPRIDLIPNGKDFIQQFNVISLSEEELSKELERAKSEKLEKVNSIFNNKMKSLVSSYPEMEIATFYKQEEEARLIINNEEPKTNMLASLAEQRGIELKDLAQKIINKSNEFATASGYVLGQRQKIEDQINSANNVAELDAIIIEDENYVN